MSIFTPVHYVRSVSHIDLAELRAQGIDTLLVDIDNTILPRNSNEIVQELSEWAEALFGEGFKVCLVSNNWHERVKIVADALGFCMVSRALKPLPFGFLQAIRMLGSTRAKTAVVGDQLFTDMLGGNLLGLTTILVPPVADNDLPHTLFLRRIERRLLAGRNPLP